jgi:hypothetical protein
MENNLHFAGSDYDKERDYRRLASQFKSIFNLMSDGNWRTLNQIAQSTGYPAASISAQLRHARKEKNGGHTVNKKHLGEGLFSYQLVVKEQIC